MAKKKKDVVCDPVEPVEAKKERKCGNCGTALYEDEKFCPGCGTPVEVVCPSCGNKIFNGERYCPYCGTYNGCEHLEPAACPMPAPMPYGMQMYPFGSPYMFPSYMPTYPTPVSTPMGTVVEEKSEPITRTRPAPEEVKKNDDDKPYGVRYGVVGLILSLFSIFLCPTGIFPIISLIVSAVGVHLDRKNGRGIGPGVAGVIISLILVLAVVAAVVFCLAFDGWNILLDWLHEVWAAIR